MMTLIILTSISCAGVAGNGYYVDGDHYVVVDDANVDGVDVDG